MLNRHLNQHSTGKSHDLTHNDQNCGQGADGTRKRHDSHGRQVDFEGRLGRTSPMLMGYKLRPGGGDTAR